MTVTTPDDLTQTSVFAGHHTGVTEDSLAEALVWACENASYVTNFAYTIDEHTAINQRDGETKEIDGLRAGLIMALTPDAPDDASKRVPSAVIQLLEDNEPGTLESRRDERVNAHE